MIIKSMHNADITAWYVNAQYTMQHVYRKQMHKRKCKMHDILRYVTLYNVCFLSFQQLGPQTAIGNGLALAKDQFYDHYADDVLPKNKRAVWLFTDGKNNAGLNPETWAYILKNMYQGKLQFISDSRILIILWHC